MKSYVKCAGKVRIDKAFYTKDEAMEWAKHGQIGLWIPQGMIVIDVDNRENADKLYNLCKDLKCGINRTYKGYHFFFKDNIANRKQSTKAVCGLGIEVDTRTANKGYVVLPYNDENRKVVKPFPEDAQEVPKWLLPLTRLSQKPQFNQGSRNSSLQSHAWRLIGNGYSKDEAKECLLLINEFILDEPLSTSELMNTVLQDKNLELAEERQKFSFNLFADDILSKLNILTINDVIHVYESGVYQNIDIEKLILDIKPDLKSSQRREVIEYVKIRTRANRAQLFSANLRNGIFTRQGQRLEHSPTFNLTSQCNFFYDENAFDLGMDTFLNDISSGNEEKKRLLLEIVGCCCFDDNHEQKIFMFVGEKASNGKSTFLNVIAKLIGAVSHVTLSNIASGGFMTPELDGALVNISSDISTKYIKDTEMLKLLTGGDSLTVARKFGQPFKMTPFAKFLFSTNRVPDTQLDKGFLRRLLLVDFVNVFDNKSGFMVENILHQTALDYLGTISLKAYFEKLQRGEWSYLEGQTSLLTDYVVTSDSTRSFLNEYDVEIGMESKKLYHEYRYYCIENGLIPKNNRNFYEGVREVYSIKKTTVGGATANRIYKKEEVK